MFAHLIYAKSAALLNGNFIVLSRYAILIVCITGTYLPVSGTHYLLLVLDFSPKKPITRQEEGVTSGSEKGKGNAGKRNFLSDCREDRDRV